MEDDRDHIEDLKQRYGYEEKEAQAVYHLREARMRFGEIYQDDAVARAAFEQAVGVEDFPKIYASLFLMNSVIPHFDALEGLLVKKALERQYPEGWGRRHQEGEGTEEG
jgi:hypothetical protein